MRVSWILFRDARSLRLILCSSSPLSQRQNSEVMSFFSPYKSLPSPKTMPQSRPSLCYVTILGVQAASPGTKEGEDRVKVVIKEVTEADHHIKGDGLQKAHHLYVLANETQDGEGCVGDDGCLWCNKAVLNL